MKKIIYYISLILLLIPLVGFADDQNHTIGMNGAFYTGCGSNGGQGASLLCQKYLIDGETATCLDPDAPNPNIINSYTKITLNDGAFAKGLMVIHREMMNLELWLRLDYVLPERDIVMVLVLMIIYQIPLPLVTES